MVRTIQAFIGIVVAASTLVLVPTPACAQLRIGQTAGFTGAVAVGVKELTDGAKLYFDAVNAQGGVNGQPIELVSLDDRFDPPIAAANATRLAADAKVLALFQSWGTPQTEAMLPALKRGGLALVGPATGAMVLHSPVHPNVFNVRAPYQREAQNAVRHLSNIGIKRFALLHPDDSFGADTAAGAAKGFAEIPIEPVVLVRYDRGNPDFTAAIADIVRRDVQAVLFFGSSQAVSDGVQALRKAGSKAQVVTLSNNASQGFITMLGSHARGIVISQVLPNERSVQVPMVKEALTLARAQGLDGVSPSMMQGFASAKVMVEALRRAGKAPTRESVIAALNGMRNYDLGGLAVGYSPTDHTGLDFADLAIVDSEGKLRR